MRSLCPDPRVHWISGSYAAMIGVASVTITTPCNLYTSAGQRFLQAPRRGTGRNTRRISCGEEVTDGGGFCQKISWCLARLRSDRVKVGSKELSAFVPRLLRLLVELMRRFTRRAACLLMDRHLRRAVSSTCCSAMYPAPPHRKRGGRPTGPIVPRRATDRQV